MIIITKEAMVMYLIWFLSRIRAIILSTIQSSKILLSLEQKLIKCMIERRVFSSSTF